MSSIISNEGREHTDALYEKYTGRCIANAHPIIATYAMYLSGKQKSTITRYTNIAADFLDYVMEVTGKTDLKEIFQDPQVNPILVTCYIKTPRNKQVKQISSNTYALRKNMLKKFFDFLVLDQITDKNLCDNIDSVRMIPKRKKDRLTDDEINILLDNIADPYRLTCSFKQKNILYDFREMNEVLVKLAIMTGARFSELANLTYSAIDYERKMVTYIQKGGEERTDALDDNMIALLKDYEPKAKALLKEVEHKWETGQIKRPKNAEKLPEDQLFFSNKGSRLSNKHINHTLKVLAEGIDKTVTAHTLDIPVQAR